jgi:hypothetical protein
MKSLQGFDGIEGLKSAHALLRDEVDYMSFTPAEVQWK